MATRKAPTPIPAQAKAKAKAPVAPVVRAKPAPAPVPAPLPASAGKGVVKSKQELVRDSFKMPKNEYVLIETLKQRALASGRAAKKSEILRAGVGVLNRMSTADLMTALANVPSLKTGRPKDAFKAIPAAASRKK